jgi:protoporphyrinogen oxidase
VIGAGPAGLTAGYLLAQRDVQVTVLEADDQVGGISRTESYKGYRFDIGGHRFFTKIEPVQRMWEEVLTEEFLTVPRLSRIYYRGKFFDYPFKAGNALGGLGPWESVRIILSYLKAHFRPSPVEENFEQWVSNRFGRRLYEIFFKTYTEKVWGVPCTEIRAEWAAQRIKGLSLARAVLSAASLNNRSDAIKTLINEFRYPRLGPGQMWEMCRDRVEEFGGRVLLNHRADGIVIEGDRAVAVRAQTSSGQETFEADHVISSMPLRSLIRTFEPEPDRATRTAAEGLRYRDFILVALVVDAADLFPDNWIYIHTPGMQVGRIQNFKNWSPSLVPDQERSCVGMEYFCFEGDGLWESSDAELIRLATEELAALGLADARLVVDGTVIRMPKAYPIYDFTYSDCIATIRRDTDPIRNLHTVGRNGMHKYNNQDHSMLTAMMTVWNMEGANHDVWEVNTDYEYLEEQRVHPQLGSAADNESTAGTPASDAPEAVMVPGSRGEIG